MTQERDYKKLSHRLIEQWRNQNVPLNPGATEQELSDLEKRFGLTLPEDFRYFYSLVNGMPDCEVDDHLFNLWPLSKISESITKGEIDRTGNSNKTEIVFGDFLIDSYRFLLTLSEEGNYVRTEMSVNEKLGGSFAHFIERYLSEADKFCL